MEIRYARRAMRALARMPVSAALRITQKIEQYARDPNSLGNNVRKLQGRDYLRLRVGDYRVIFTTDGTVLDVLKIGPRSSVYED